MTEFQKKGEKNKLWMSEIARKSLNIVQALFNDSHNSDVSSELFWSRVWNTATYGLLWTKLKCSTYKYIQVRQEAKTE